MTFTLNYYSLYLGDVTRFDEDNIMFEEEWDETHRMFEKRFDAPTAFMSLVRNNPDDKTPALISKFARWMTISSQEHIEAVWAKCERECDKLEKERGRYVPHYHARIPQIPYTYRQRK